MSASGRHRQRVADRRRARQAEPSKPHRDKYASKRDDDAMRARLEALALHVNGRTGRER